MEQYSDIEWNMIKGLRNRIVHDYDGINLKSIWFVLQHDVLELKNKIQEIINTNKEDQMLQSIGMIYIKNYRGYIYKTSIFL